MLEVTKQESQKTIVAFISGLLIGGLLVWVFSSTPESAMTPENGEEDTTEDTTTVEEEDDEDTTDTSEPETGEDSDSEASITVNDQAAGNTVSIESLSLPAENGWVVVRDYVNGTSGNILGAARFSEEENLIPQTVRLIRGTTAGNTYQVVFFTNGGNIDFNLEEDVLIEGIEDTFTAR